MIQSIISTTLGQLATGVLVFIAFIPPSRIGKGFGRFHTALALVLWLLALWGNFSTWSWILFGALILACALAGTDFGYYPFLIASILISFYILTSGKAHDLYAHIPPVLVLGASSVAMLLGHWYLVTPKLSIGYLKIITVGLLCAIILRSGLLVETLLSNQAILTGNHFYEIYGIFFWQRIVLGLALTFVLTVMTYLCVRIRSTQSATGILYVVVVFCLAGELIGSYLFNKTGILF